MAWTWAGYVNRGVMAATAQPSNFAFGCALFAFTAGLDLRTLKHSGTPLDYSFVALSLVVSALWGYFLTKAVDRLRNGGTTTK
jgi:hypothetical protein